MNPVLGFPFIFRGALDVRATKINEAMKKAAKTITRIILHLQTTYMVSPKAEHSPGILLPLIIEDIASWEKKQTQGYEFYNPHLKICKKICITSLFLDYFLLQLNKVIQLCKKKRERGTQIIS